jgi:uncharacterized cupin superfamily protein
MAQVKLYKFDDTIGETMEHEAADDLTMATLTAATQVTVTGGVDITNNITFNTPLSDTINGIIADNLLDSSANETITGTYSIDTGAKLVLSDAPTLSLHATNKEYVDQLAQGNKRKDAVVVATTANITLSGEQTIDGVLTSVSRVLVKDQTNQTENGIYVSAAGAWTRTADADTGAEILAAITKVLQGTTNIDRNFQNTNSTEPTIGATNITFTDLGSSSTHNSLAGLQGGNGSDQFYHLDLTEHTWANDAIAKVSDGSNVMGNDVNDTYSAELTVSGLIDAATGDMVAPTTDMAVPVNGAFYWNDTTGTWEVYSATASAYVSISPTDAMVYTAGAGGITAGQLVYISANDTILPADANTYDESKGIAGIAITTGAAAADIKVVDAGIAAGVLTGATFNTIYYLSETPGALTTTPPTTAGASVVRVGNAKNATDLQMRVKFIVKRR